MAVARSFSLKVILFLGLVLALALLSCCAEGAPRLRPRSRSRSRSRPRSRPQLRHRHRHRSPIRARSRLPIRPPTRPIPVPILNNGVVANVKQVVDVTKFGARPDGVTNNAMAFIQAWNSACKSSTGPSKLVIPPGKYLVGEVIFGGPCTSNPIIVEIQGTILANTDMSEFSGKECFMFQDVDALTVLGGGTFDGQGQSAWKYESCSSSDNCDNNLPVSVKFQKIRNGIVRDINLVNSKGFHMTITSCNNFSAERLKITAPGNSPRTDGIHISRSSQIRVSDSIIGTGDDCISIGEGSVGVNISGITCGPGHGISIGSLGKPLDASVKEIVVSRSTISNATNGVRIKTFHNSPKIQASGITFEDITMTNVKNPIIIDQHYQSKKKPGASNVKISDVHYKNIRGSSISNVAVTLNCSSTAPCEGVELVDIDFTLSPNSLNKFPLSASCSFAKPAFRGKQKPAPCK